MKTKNLKDIMKLIFSFILSDTSKIKENFIFNLVKKKNDNYISRLYNPDDLTYITFEKDTNIFIEMKSSLKRANVDEITNKFQKIFKNFCHFFIENGINTFSSFSFHIFFS